MLDAIDMENKMLGNKMLGKGTYLVIRDSGNGETYGAAPS